MVFLPQEQRVYCAVPAEIVVWTGFKYLYTLSPEFSVKANALKHLGFDSIGLIQAYTIEIINSCLSIAINSWWTQNGNRTNFLYVVCTHRDSDKG
jgi:hypothetical membrane protein